MNRAHTTLTLAASLTAALSLSVTPAGARAQAHEMGHPAVLHAEHGAAVDELMTEYNRSDAPGAVIGVVHHGELIFARAYGMASLEQGTRLTTASILDVGSVSKQMTARTAPEDLTHRVCNAQAERVGDSLHTQRESFGWEAGATRPIHRSSSSTWFSRS